MARRQARWRRGASRALPHAPLPFVVNEIMAENSTCAARSLGRRIRLGSGISLGAPCRCAPAAVGAIRCGYGRRVSTAADKNKTKVQVSSRRRNSVDARLNSAPIELEGSHAFDCEACIRMAAVAVLAGGPALAQQKPNQARVQTSEPPPSQCGAAAEIKARQWQVRHRGLSHKRARQETGINTGMTLGTVDMIIGGPHYGVTPAASPAIHYLSRWRPLIAYSKSDVSRRWSTTPQRNRDQITALPITQATSNKPFTDCAGMKGLKIRVPDVPVAMATPKAAPTPRRSRSPRPLALQMARSTRRRIR